MEKFIKNSEYTAEIISYNSEGLGVARINGNAVFVPNTIVGEKHKIRIVKSNNTVTYGISIECLAASPSRNIAECPYFNKCGGCHLMHMSYEEELKFKLNKVNEALKRIGKIDFVINEIVPSDLVHRYRNKAVFNVANGKVGFYKMRSHDLIEINDCVLQQINSLKIAKEIYSDELNHISIRGNVCTIYGNDYHGPIPGDITGLVLCRNNRENSLLDGEYNLLWGSSEQILSLGKYKFYVSPQSFFQVNSKQAEKLYMKTVELAGYGDTAVELYCGVGTISAFLSENFKNIRSCEIVPQAIENANLNKELNSICNIDFTCCDSKNMINYHSDVIVVDPPRKGLDEEVINLLLKSNTERIVYVSCNPSTLARDIYLLSSKYDVNKATCFDMFPRTFHVETVVLMSKKQ